VVFATAAIMVSGQIDPEYRATASMVIIPANEGDAGLFQGQGLTQSNPLDYLGGQVTLTGIQLILGAEDARAELAAAGFSPAYSVEVDAKDPLMLVEATDRDPAVAQTTVDELVIRVQEELDTLQAAVNAPSNQLLEIQVLSQTELPAQDFGARTRIRLILAILGVLIASAAGLLVDAWATGRAERREEEAGGDGADATDPDHLGDVNQRPLEAAGAHGSHFSERDELRAVGPPGDDTGDDDGEFVAAPVATTRVEQPTARTS
jgi:hypothetical protein